MPHPLEHAARPAPSALSARLILLLAASAGMAVAALYYSQPLLGILGPALNASEKDLGLIPTLTQVGYALGILFLAPLGDRHDRRSIILIKCLVLILALTLAGLSPSSSVLMLASLLIGLSATLTQDIVPTAASLANAAQRGRVVGTVMTGLLLGILLSRVVSGLIAEWFGWRSVFFLAAGSVGFIAVGAWRYLPSLSPQTNLGYGALLASLRTLWHRHPELRQAAIAQGLLSVGFSAFWSNLAIMLHAAPFHLGSAAAGSFGIAGAAGALAAPLAGHLADRHGPQRVTRLGALLTTAAFIGLAATTQIASSSLQLILLGLGTVLFDLGIQATLIAHQTLIYRIDPAARSRLNAVLIFGMFSGMASGAALGNLLLQGFGWMTVMIFSALAASLALLIRLRAR